MTTTNTGSNAFWEFSLGLYALQGVSAACLRLQDEQAVDVNLLLYALWRGWRGDWIEPADLAAVDAAVSNWRTEVVQPIRQLRRQLCEVAGVEPARERIKQAELEAEREQQSRMYELSPIEPGGREQDPCLQQALVAFAGFHGLEPKQLEGMRKLALQYQELPS